MDPRFYDLIDQIEDDAAGFAAMRLEPADEEIVITTESEVTDDGAG